MLPELPVELEDVVDEIPLELVLELELSWFWLLLPDPRVVPVSELVWP